MNNIHETPAAIKSRAADSTKFTSFVFACLRQVDADPETSSQELRLAFVISQMLNKKTRTTFPLQATLAKRLGVSDRAIREYISGLVDRGHMKVRHRGRDNSSIYELILQDRNTASGHDTQDRNDTSGLDAGDPNQDRKSDVARPEVSRAKTGTVLPTVPTSVPTSVSKKESKQEGGAPQARHGADSLRDSVGSRESLKSPMSTIVDDGDALRAPPDHLQRGLIIDQDGNEFTPPPQRSQPKDWMSVCMAGYRGRA